MTPEQAYDEICAAIASAPLDKLGYRLLEIVAALATTSHAAGERGMRERAAEVCVSEARNYAMAADRSEWEESYAHAKTAEAMHGAADEIRALPITGEGT
jgi:hypothetical protein